MFSRESLNNDSFFFLLWGENTLRLRLRVRKVEEVAGSHVHIDAELLAVQQAVSSPKPRIIQLGPMSSDEEIGQEFGEHVVGSFQKALQQRGFLPMPQKPLSAVICMCITKQYFEYLGRPTVDDYIELNARTDRGR